MTIWDLLFVPILFVVAVIVDGIWNTHVRNQRHTARLIQSSDDLPTKRRTRHQRRTPRRSEDK